jgi:hypothetical protein
MIERTGAPRVLGFRVVVEIRNARSGIEHDVFQNRTEAVRRRMNLLFGLWRKPDRLSVTSAFEIEDALGRPAVLVVTEQGARGVGGERGLAGVRGAILSAVHQVKGLDPKTEHKVQFYTRQFVDALAPSNFVATNPEVLKQTIETGGRNLLHGLSNLLNDLERGRGRLAITMTDPNAFRVGENVATTSGKVIFELSGLSRRSTSSPVSQPLL